MTRDSRVRLGSACATESCSVPLAEGDFELAMRGLLGEQAPLSKATMRRLREGWTQDFEAWGRRSPKDREVVYAWADGIYVKAGPGAGQGRPAGGDWRVAGRHEGGPGHRVGLPGVDRVLDGGVAGSEGPRDR